MLTSRGAKSDTHTHTHSVMHPARLRFRRSGNDKRPGHAALRTEREKGDQEARRKGVPRGSIPIRSKTRR